MKYDSDIDHIQYKRIQIFFEKKGKRGRPLKYRLIDVINGILYVEKTGCHWRSLPRDFPPWKVVYCHFRKWTKDSRIEKILKFLVKKERQRHHRKREPSLLILDSQSVRMAEQRFRRGFDGNKKIKGRKRHILGDVLGMPHGISLSDANESDQKEGLKLIENLKEGLERVKVLLVDGGYKGKPFTERVKELRGWEVEVSERLTESTQKGFKVEPLRWVIERSFSWLERSRRLVRDYEVKIEHSISMIQLHFIKLILFRLRYA